MALGVEESAVLVMDRAKILPRDKAFAGSREGVVLLVWTIHWSLGSLAVECGSLLASVRAFPTVPHPVNCKLKAVSVIIIAVGTFSPRTMVCDKVCTAVIIRSTPCFNKSKNDSAIG